LLTQAKERSQTSEMFNRIAHIKLMFIQRQFRICENPLLVKSKMADGPKFSIFKSQ